MAVGKYPAVDSAGEASAEIRGGVPVALWTRPVEHGRASCGRGERRRGAAMARGGAIGGDGSGYGVNGSRDTGSVWSRCGGRCERRGGGVQARAGSRDAWPKEEERKEEKGKKEKRRERKRGK
jgi:hypothetical protein